MPMAPITEHVDDDRLAEMLALFGGDLGRVDYGFGIDVEERNFVLARFEFRNFGKCEQINNTLALLRTSSLLDTSII